MKRQASMILTALSLLVMLTGTSVNAQSDMRFKVNIPFAFSVPDKILPAGEYTVGYLARGVLAIRSVDGDASQSFVTLFTQASAVPEKTSLVFNRYGDQYFLSTIWTAGDNKGYQLRKPKAEKKLIRERRLLAQSASERQTVAIVAHR